jgi:hypothetical protein
MRGWSLKVDEGLYNFGFWILVSRSKEEEDLEEGQFCPFELFFSESASFNPTHQ